MNLIPYFIPYIILFTACAVSRIISERSLRYLSSEQKVTLLDSFSRHRAFACIPAIFIFGVYGVSVCYFKAQIPKTSVIFFGVLGAYAIGYFFLIFKKLKTLILPSKYIRLFYIKNAIIFGAGAVFFVSVIFGIPGDKSHRSLMNWNKVRYVSGELHYEYNYDGEKLQGITKEYSKNGKLLTEWNYADGELNGLTKSYYEAGELRCECNYVHNVLQGISKEYSQNGRLLAESNFVGGELKNSLKKSYYETGELHYEWNYVRDALQGMTKEYSKNGKMLNVWNYVDGKLNGITKSYYETGELRYEYNYVNGALQGITKEYSKEGKLSAEWNYVDGALKESPLSKQPR